MSDVSLFRFPHEPYPVQVEFMRALYDALDKRQIAILESPTGTVRVVSRIRAQLFVCRASRNNAALPTHTHALARMHAIFRARH